MSDVAFTLKTDLVAKLLSSETSTGLRMDINAIRETAKLDTFARRTEKRLQGHKEAGDLLQMYLYDQRDWLVPGADVNYKQMGAAQQGEQEQHQQGRILAVNMRGFDNGTPKDDLVVLESMENKITVSASDVCSPVSTELTASSSGRGDALKLIAEMKMFGGDADEADYKSAGPDGKAEEANHFLHGVTTAELRLRALSLAFNGRAFIVENRAEVEALLGPAFVASLLNQKIPKAFLKHMTDVLVTLAPTGIVNRNTLQFDAWNGGTISKKIYVFDDAEKQTSIAEAANVTAWKDLKHQDPRSRLSRMTFVLGREEQAAILGTGTGFRLRFHVTVSCRKLHSMSPCQICGAMFRIRTCTEVSHTLPLSLNRMRPRAEPKPIPDAKKNVNAHECHFWTCPKLWRWRTVRLPKNSGKLI